MTQKIYFDESGFTGNNLLHPVQNFFAYASVATDDDEARDIVESLIAKHRVQGNELKGKRLVQSYRGRQTIDEIFQRFEGRLKVSISDKKFALACKLFEYIFEPSFSSINSLFYGIGFHRFVANILYVEFKARGAGAEAIFSEFEAIMRAKAEPNLETIFSSSVHEDNPEVITQIREFAQCRADDIRREMLSLEKSNVAKWVLDLTNTSLYTLLCQWGTKYNRLTAVCDPSEPLKHDPSIFESMIGREDKIVEVFFGRSQPITFNLSGPIEFADSKHTHGIQIADAVAAAAVHVLSGAEDDHAVRWRKLIVEICADNGSILPDHSEVSLKDWQSRRNAAVLTELHARAMAGVSLTDGMPEYLRKLTKSALRSAIAPRSVSR
ncbi:DUF3800 domain-containing protein [Paraburkholderia graminis]|uniref:DUF3800 domain-containing protein n=1 Tax=Paraburkholderia graminis TaxID=60548 RepID=A0ABD5CS20_9BURK|nr:DUF3800 domain-containing protein [Paraburkholderia graminis]MDR6208136.1 hypothetical protein [Paraburkholderia graminis]